MCYFDTHAFWRTQVPKHSYTKLTEYLVSSISAIASQSDQVTFASARYFIGSIA